MFLLSVIIKSCCFPQDCSFSEMKKLCWDQLQQLSEIHLLEILEGKYLKGSSNAQFILQVV